MNEMFEILKMMSRACPVSSKVSISFDIENPDAVIEFRWNFKIKDRPYHHCHEIGCLDFHKLSVEIIVQEVIIGFKEKFKSLVKTT